MVLVAINPSVLATATQPEPTLFQAFLITMLLYNAIELAQKGSFYFCQLAVNSKTYQVAQTMHHAVRVEDTHSE